MGFRCLLGILLALSPAVLAAQAADLSAVLLSDLHFDPLHDPAKVARLSEASVEAWDKILAEPDSPTQAADFTAMQTECSTRGVDPDNALLNSTLKAAHDRAPEARFVTITGDLLVHDFGCRYHALTHGKAAPGTGTALIEKSVNYVIRRVDAAFPAIPIYFVLGNNDSSCGDYHLAPHDRFLAATVTGVLHGLRGASPAELKTAQQTYEQGGFYSVPLAGVEKTRVIALDDIYSSALYADCASTKTASEAAEQIQWLDHELTSAKERGEKVWLLGHIPPGPDAFSTLRHLRSMCSRPPTMFLASDALADTLARHADVIRIALFAHTHEDEFRLLERVGNPAAVPVKLVPAVSAINGNLPAFTVAEVNRASAILDDYTVYMLPNAAPSAGWTREYSLRDTYHLPNFSAKSVRTLVEQLQADKGGAQPESQAYQKFFLAGESSPLFLVWPQYTCALSHDREADFKQCMCSQ